MSFFSGDSKNSYLHADGSQEGYFPYEGDYSIGESRVRDRKEFFHVRPSGVYPGEVSDAALRYFREASALAVRLLGWMDEQAPGEVAGRFSEPLPAMLEGSSGSVLRIQHYLPLAENEKAGAIRALAHTDINLVTLLPAPREPGLQVCDVDGAWHDVSCDSGAMIINAGEMLQLASGGYYPATPHQVVNPGARDARGSRLSLPLFIHPFADTVLADGVTASEFLRERVSVLRRRGWRAAAGGQEGSAL